MILAIVLDRVIIATGEYREADQITVEGGKVRVGGSMFDCFAKNINKKLIKEFNELGIGGISKVTLYDRFGGRTQVLGPDALINIFMALYNGNIEPIKQLIEGVRGIAKIHNNMQDKNLLGKMLAAFSLISV